jgi:hypothetical protein
MDISQNTVLALDERNYSLSYMQNFSATEIDNIKEAKFLPHYIGKPQIINKVIEDGQNCIYIETDGKKLERHGIMLTKDIPVNFDMAVEVKIKPIGDSEGVGEFWLFNEEIGKCVGFKLFGGYYGIKKETIIDFNGERIYMPIKLWDWGNWYYLHIQLRNNKTVMALLDDNRCILAWYCYEQSMASLFQSFSIAVSQEMGMYNSRSNLMKAFITDIKVGLCLKDMQDLMTMPTKNDLIVAEVEENIKKVYAITNMKDRYDRLLELWKRYQTYEPKIDFYLRPIIKEYLIFHDLTSEISDEIENNENSFLHFKIISEFKNHTPKELTEALNGFSNYHILKSKFYKEFGDDINEVVYNVYRIIHKNNFFQKFFGSGALMPYYIFKSALFGDKLDKNYLIQDWQEDYYGAAFQKKTKIKMIGEILKAIDSLMRSQYGYPISIEKPKIFKAYDTAVVSEVNKFCTENMKINSYVPNIIMKKTKTQVPAPKPVEIDVSILDDIRSAAEHIQERLITDETVPKILVVQTGQTMNENIVPAIPLKNTSQNNLLSEVQMLVIKAIFYNDINAMNTILRENGLMLSVVIEEINEIIFDRLNDNCILFEEDKPVILEDYIEDLKGIINL